MRWFLYDRELRHERVKHEEDTVNDNIKVAKTLNNSYINVAENTTSKKTVSVLDLYNIYFSTAIKIY